VTEGRLLTCRPMGRRNELRLGEERVRIGPWRGSQQVGLVTPLSGPIAPGRELVERACAELANRGFREVVTGALADDELDGFEACAFELRDSLHLLAHDLRRLPEVDLPVGVRLVRGNRLRRAAALRVDARAFPPFWRLDIEGLVEALLATTDVRFRTARSGGDGARSGGRVVGYAVTGLTGTMGYLQRLAVDPDREGGGIGRALVVDGLCWLHERGAGQAVVNTQVDNHRALGLYRSIGFTLLPSGLSVLGRALEHAPPGGAGTSIDLDAIPGRGPRADGGHG
jgi:ribosomal protein S18 acetylase RimI-like enzyme